MSATLTDPQTHEIVTRVEKGERISVVGIDFGLLDTEVREIVDRVRAARASRGTTARPTPAAVPSQGGNSRPDEIRVLIDSAAAHPSKRVQAAGTRVTEAIDKLKAAVREVEEKHAERRRQAAKRVAAKAEVERLTQALADAKAKLRGPKPAPRKASDGSPTPAEIRSWAVENGIECPTRGQIPRAVQEAYRSAHHAHTQEVSP